MMLEKILCLNRKASFEYFLEDKFEAGIMLKGSEVKSIKSGQSNINDAFVIEKKNELYLINAHISQYTFSNVDSHVEKTPRKLLLHRGEIDKLIGNVKRKGYAIIPLKVYLNARGKVKIEIALAKGKAMADKRESIKEKEWHREQSKLLKNYK